jgi:hypothetical protein
MSSDGKGEAAILVNEDELAKLNIEDKLRNRAISEAYKYRSLDESVSSEGSSDHGKIVRP